MDWKKKIGIWVLSLMLEAAVSITAMADETTFVPGTLVNGLGISNMTVEEAEAHINQFYSSEYELKIIERGGTYETIDGTKIGFQVTVPDGVLQEILDGQNASGRVFGPDVDNKYRIAMQSVYDAEALTAEIGGLRCITEAGSKPTTDARLSEYQEGQAFTIIPEVRGNSADTEKITELVRASVEAGARELNLEEQGCYREPQVVSTDEGLAAACRLLNQKDAVNITYTFGETAENNGVEEDNEVEENDEIKEMNEVLGWETIVSWVLGAQDGQLVIDREKAEAYVKNLAEAYDTVNTERVFTTVSGREVSLTGPYGWKINQAAEVDALIALIQNGESQTRTPIYANTAASRTAPEWGTTYAEVDLSGQHVYLIQDGAVVWDAPCVTGNPSKGYDTPSGIYSVTYKETNRVLRGAKRKDGSYEYESPVSYWIPFNQGIGLHDANWRTNFGGTIYKTSGSHGCVNLPPKQVPELYERVYKGMPVICYELGN